MRDGLSTRGRSTIKFVEYKVFLGQSIYSNYRNLMHQVCQQCIQSRDYTTLREVMLKFAYFWQLHFHLQESELQQLLASVQYESGMRHEPLTLEAGNVYFFLERGVIYRKEVAGKSQKSIRMREKTRLLVNTSKNNSRLPQIKQPFSYSIEEFDSFEDTAVVSNRYSQHLYYCHGSKAPAALCLPLRDLGDDVRMRVRGVGVQKIKFLGDCGELKKVQRQVLVQNSHKFKFVQVHFGQAVFSRRVRPQFVFFLRKGLVEITHSGKLACKSVISARSALGLEEGQSQTARCISEQVQCYAIKRQELNSLIYRIRHKKEASQGLHKYGSTFCQTVATTPACVEEESQPSELKRSVIIVDRVQQNAGKEELVRRRHCHRSMSNLRAEQKRDRLFKLRQHFSNFYNQVFNEFSSRKIKYMGLDIENKENLVLYQMKVMHKKAPNMEEIKHKLRRMRVEKMRVCREELGRQGHIRQAEEPGGRVVGRKG